jgi:hypothetical protein
MIRTVSIIETMFRHQLPDLFATTQDENAMRVAIRLAVEFRAFLERPLDKGGAGRDSLLACASMEEAPDHKFFRRAATLAQIVRGAEQEEAVSQVDYTDETTIACLEFLWTAQQVLSRSLLTSSSMISWVSYESFKALRADYVDAFAVFEDPAADAQEHVTALMTLSKLQVVFLASTF